MEIDLNVARKVLDTVRVGLTHGIGTPEPGKMCVEAAVCYALGLPHGDAPSCVAPALRQLKIRLNDSRWSSDQARAKGLERLALIQLGSAGHLDEKEFARRVSRLAIQSCIPQALRAAARLFKGEKKDAMLNAADLCEREPTTENARAARTAAYAAAADAAYAAAVRDTSLAAFAEGVVQILIDMKVPGVQWLHLTEVAPYFARTGAGLRWESPAKPLDRPQDRPVSRSSQAGADSPQRDTSPVDSHPGTKVNAHECSQEHGSAPYVLSKAPDETTDD